MYTCNIRVDEEEEWTKQDDLGVQDPVWLANELQVQ